MICGIGVVEFLCEQGHQVIDVIKGSVQVRVVGGEFHLHEPLDVVNPFVHFLPCLPVVLNLRIYLVILVAHRDQVQYMVPFFCQIGCHREVFEREGIEAHNPHAGIPHLGVGMEDDIRVPGFHVPDKEVRIDAPVIAIHKERVAGIGVNQVPEFSGFFDVAVVRRM